MFKQYFKEKKYHKFKKFKIFYVEEVDRSAIYS